MAIKNNHNYNYNIGLLIKKKKNPSPLGHTHFFKNLNKYTNAPECIDLVVLFVQESAEYFFIIIKKKKLNCV